MDAFSFLFYIFASSLSAGDSASPLLSQQHQPRVEQVGDFRQQYIRINRF